MRNDEAPRAKVWALPMISVKEFLEQDTTKAALAESSKAARLDDKAIVASANKQATKRTQDTSDEPVSSDADMCQCVDGATNAANEDKPKIEDEIKRLAALSDIEYQQVRKDEAKRLNVNRSFLDGQVSKAKSIKTDEDAISSMLVDVEPWQEPIDPAQLLYEITSTIHRFIICQPETAQAAALWAAMTWFIDVIQVAPLAVITAPEKRCGKSQLLTVIGKLSKRSFPASNITPAALFRSIEEWQPTLLIDEADAFMNDNEELRGLLNGGWTRDLAYTVRTVGDEHVPKLFSTWGAKAISGIGKLSDTLMDRAIMLELRRKLPNEQTERLRHDDSGSFDKLKAKLARFAQDYKDTIKASRPEAPNKLNDRAKDNWEPLLAIADVAGGDWPIFARAAALKLSVKDDNNETVGTELLSDIKDIFEKKKIKKISTINLLQELCEDEEVRWFTYNRGKQMVARQLSNRLKEYGITPKNVRLDPTTQTKGYECDQFDEAFSRYIISPDPDFIRPAVPNDNFNNKINEVTGTDLKTGTDSSRPNDYSSGTAGRIEKSGTEEKKPSVPLQLYDLNKENGNWDGGTDKIGYEGKEKKQVKEQVKVTI